MNKYLNFTPTEEYLELEREILGEGFKVIATAYYPHYIFPYHFAYLGKSGIPEIVMETYSGKWLVRRGVTELGRSLTIKQAIELVKGE